MPAAAAATPAQPTTKVARPTSLKPSKDSANRDRDSSDDATNHPSTSSSSRPVANRPKSTSLRLAQALEMLDEFDRSAQSNYRQNIREVQNTLLDRMDSLLSSLAALSSGSNSSDTDSALRIEQRRQASQTLNSHLICFQNAAFAARDLAAQQAAIVFEKINKHRPLEVKVKRGKITKKDRKEKETPASSKSDRTVQREKVPATKAQSSTPVQPEPLPETPVTTNNRVINKRRATQTPTTLTPTEKKSKKENGVKKRTSNRLSKTPRVKAKEEDEPTYCFCSRISFGEMIGCDNDKCEIEWFHFECIGLTTKPKGKWFCPNCRHPDSARMPKASRVINANNRNNAAVEKV